MPFPFDATDLPLIERHFKKPRAEWKETFFIAALESDRKQHVYWATLALRECGSRRAIPALRAVLDFPMADVQCTSLLTIAHLGRNSETPLYAELLASPIYKDKFCAMWAILDAADERAVPAVLEYFGKHWAKIAKGKLMTGTTPNGVEYLHRFAKRADVRALLERVRAAWPGMGAGEKTEILKRIPNFVAPK
jgi:hypothetical protein